MYTNTPNGKIANDRIRKLQREATRARLASGEREASPPRGGPLSRRPLSLLRRRAARA
jgi:hypothetical protein